MILIIKKNDSIELLDFDFEYEETTLSQIIKEKKDISLYKNIVILGGDGSILRSVHFTKNVPRVFAFNFGTLGHLTTYDKGDFVNLNEILRRGDDFLIRKRLKFNEIYFLNEVVLTTKKHRLNTFTLRMLGGSKILHGDALIVSTPSGSTGYNHSVGGPTLLCDCIVINLVAPSKCNFRPLVVGVDAKIEIEVHSDDGLCIADGLEYLTNHGTITFDGNEIEFGYPENFKCKKF